MTPTVSDPLTWPLDVSVKMQSSYRQSDPTLDAIFAKAKAQQWNVDEYDWSSELNPDNPLALPDEALFVSHTPLWKELSEERRIEARRHSQGWTLSQILHGEQAAMLCAAKLAQGESDFSARLCAAIQVTDEARHVEAYSRLVNDKIRLPYGLPSGLAGLMEDTICASDLDITNLGMQILIEGMALSTFHSIVEYTRDPFVRSLVARIQRDEARHFAIGRITLTRLYTQELSAAEIRVREEFLCESVSILYEHLCADDIWEPLGHDKEKCSKMVRDSPIADALRRGMFARLVPTIRDMGLTGPSVMRLLESLRLVEYMAAPTIETA